MIAIPVSSDLSSAFVATLAVRASIALGAAWLLSLALRRAAAATRHAVWNAALASLLALPVISLVLPRWELPSAEANRPALLMPAPSAITAATTPSAAPAVPGEHDHDTLMSAPMPARRGANPAVVILFGLWALGAAFGLGRLSAGWAAACRLVRRARPLPTGDADVAVRDLSILLGVHRPVRVLASDTLSVPVNCGLFRPVILLPTGAAQWTAERLRVVLLHELAHVHRWDYASMIATEAARALYWMNPLVWLAARAANVELERACDDEVLRAGTRSVEYAQHLYDIAASLGADRSPRGALAMAAPSTLGTRVGAILSAGMDRSPLRPRALAGAAAAALLIGIPLASIQLLGEGREAAADRASIRLLTAGDPDTRSHAAWLLGNRRSARAMEPLTMRLRDDNPTVRGMAAWALGTIGSREALAALEGALHDSDADVREMAVLAVAEIGDRGAVELLAPLARDPEMGVRGVLTHALHQLGGGRAGEVLGGMMLHDADDHVRNMAIWSYRLTLGNDATPLLLEALRARNPDDRQAAARNLGELADARALDGLASALHGDSVPSVRGASAYALGALGDARAADPLAAALHDETWMVRVAVAGALGSTPGPRAADALIAATRDPVHQVRLTAVESLNQHAR